MYIEFLFSDIKDISQIYAEREYICRFDGSTQIDPIYVGREYCTSTIGNVAKKVPEILEWKYRGTVDRVANEVYELHSASKIYTISCTIDTYKKGNPRLLICISSEANIGHVQEETEATGDVDEISGKYDRVLEKLKLEVKSAFRDDWKSCVWIQDQQSEYLCSVLYTYVFRTENSLRAFVSKVLLWKLGINWFDRPGLEKYRKEYDDSSTAFHKSEPAFSDIDDVFISTTIMTLFKIISKGIVYEPELRLSHDQVKDLIKSVESGKSICDWINKARTRKVSIWTDIFAPYFENAGDAHRLINDFNLNRNHIAHNKPLTSSAYKRMKRSFTELDEMVKKANSKFEESNLSEEAYTTIDILNEQARDAAEQQEYEQNYLRARILDEVSIEILWEEDIFELFEEKVEALYQKIYDDYYWDSKFTISALNMLDKSEQCQVLFDVKCNACEECHLEIQAEFSIDEDMDSDSELMLRIVEYDIDGVFSIVKNGQSDVFALRYHNGSGFENIEEGGIIEPVSESELDESEMDELFSVLKTSIEALNPYIAIKESMEYSAAKSGEASPIADFPCWECDEYGISLNEDLYKFGHCCYCGTDNEVQICRRCNAPFAEGEGKSGLCNSCIDYIESE